MQEIVEMLPSMARMTLETRIRCFAHILNLVVKVYQLFACYACADCLQAILSLFIPKRRKTALLIEDPEDEQEDDAEEDVELLRAMEELDEAVEASDEAAIKELDFDEMLEARDITIELADDERKLAQSAYRKVRNPSSFLFLL